MPATMTATSVDSFEGSMSRSRRAVSRDQVELMADRVSRTRISVLILGESGVGKEVLADRIHRHSLRSAQPMVTVDCAGLCPTLVESQLFGHERGAFTGAAQSAAGFFELADGGTLFLDELGELPLTVQAKLLRVLETRTVQRLGATKSFPVDVRFLAATNRNLDLEVKQGRFRSDLLFRIDGMRLTLPPLRDRRHEILQLANGFLAQASARDQTPLRSLATETIAALQDYSWPGNIRELRNVIERAVVLCEASIIDPHHLLIDDAEPSGGGVWSGDPSVDLEVDPQVARASSPPSALGPTAASPDIEWHPDRATIVRALQHFAGNQTRAAASLGISRRTMVARMNTFGLPRPRKSGTHSPPAAPPSSLSC